jgi:hypothetical protein
MKIMRHFIEKDAEIIWNSTNGLWVKLHPPSLWIQALRIFGFYKPKYHHVVVADGDLYVDGGLVKTELSYRYDAVIEAFESKLEDLATIKRLQSERKEILDGLCDHCKCRLLHAENCQCWNDD